MSKLPLRGEENSSSCPSGLNSNGPWTCTSWSSAVGCTVLPGVTAQMSVHDWPGLMCSVTYARRPSARYSGKWLRPVGSSWETFTWSVPSSERMVNTLIWLPSEYASREPSCDQAAPWQANVHWLLVSDANPWV